MTQRPGTRRVARLGTAVATVALVTAAPGAAAIASAQTSSTSPITLTLTGVDLNRAGLDLTNEPITPDPGVGVKVFDGGTALDSEIDGNPSAVVDAEVVSLNDLVRGKTYNISVQFTDLTTGQIIGTSNTVTFTTPSSTDTTPPTTPTNLRFVPAASPPPNAFNLEWDPSTDNVTPSSGIQYIVTRDGVLDNGIDVTQADVGDVFTVTAIDTSDNRSATITFTGQ